MEKILKVIKSKWFFLGLGLFVGILIILVIRFFTYQPEAVHYHANFAVHIEGQQEEFNGMQYYQETGEASCSLERKQTPLERVHMHNNVNDAVHVHDKLVTWGAFFQNLGWGLGDDYLATSDKVYVNSDKENLVFILNGKRVDSVYNLVINDEDKLLVSYGIDAGDEMQKQYDRIEATAHKLNISKDPASCGSNIQPTFKDRLNHLF